MRSSLLIALPLLMLGACQDQADPCVGVSCATDRVCIAPERAATCVCADPAVEVDGGCVVQGSEGEGEGEG